MSTTDTRQRPAIRPAIHVLGTPRTRPALTDLGVGLVIALFLVVLAALAGVGVTLVRAQSSDEDVPRYTPASRGTRPAVTRWRPLLEEYPWDVATALRVLSCESDGDPNARNPWSGAAGLMQLYGWEAKARELYGPHASVYDPVVNIGTAYWIWAADGGRFDGTMGWQASAGCWS